MVVDVVGVIVVMVVDVVEVVVVRFEHFAFFLKLLYSSVKASERKQNIRFMFVDVC